MRKPFRGICLSSEVVSTGVNYVGYSIAKALILPMIMRDDSRQESLRKSLKKVEHNISSGEITPSDVLAILEPYGVMVDPMQRMRWYADLIERGIIKGEE